MANEEVLGPRKTMFVLVIVVGCFAVLWPRIISPLILGQTRDQLKPNQFDRDAGCCEVIFETEMAVLELINEVCNSATHAEGRLSPYAAAECRKAVNETCGLDIAAFLKRSDNVGKTSKMLLNTMKKSNSSCLKEHFGVPVWSLSTHQPLNPWTWQDTLKQERPLRGAGPHPALQERGRAIPAGAPAAPRPITMPPHVRVRSSPLAGYFEIDVKPPPIPGMRPPLGSPGGPAPTPKSSMGFVMPIYTICIIVFFVYTLSKILFNRTGTTPYEPVNPDPQFRRRVFRDDSRSTPDKLVVTAISGLVAEVQQEMEASYAQNQQRQDVQENNARRYTNGTILHNSGPVHIVASEFKDTSKENSPEIDKVNESTPEPKESSPEPKIPSVEFKEERETVSEGVKEELISEPEETSHESKDSTPEVKEPSPESETTIELKETETEEPLPESEERDDNVSETEKDITKESPLANGTSLVELNELITESVKDPEISDKKEDVFNDEEEIKANILEEALKDESDDLKELKENLDVVNDTLAQATKEFLEEEAEAIEKEQKQSTPELLEEAIKDDDQEVDDDERENASVKVVGMELTAHSADGGAWASSGQPTAVPTPTPAPTRPHEAEQVQSIFLDGAIPQQSRVLVERCEPSPAPVQAHSPMVVSGKMTLSLIQDAPRDTPERDPESTVDDFTTASAATQPAEKEEEESEEEIEEEIEVEEIEEEIEVEEDEEDEEPQKMEDELRLRRDQRKPDLEFSVEQK